MHKIKRFFETPKKAVTSILLLAVILLAAGSAAVFAAGAIARKTSIGEQNALALALKDAGIDRISVQNFQTQFDFEQGNFVYDVEFTSEGISYEYRLRASDGTILKKETDPPYSTNTRESDADTSGGQPLVQAEVSASAPGSPQSEVRRQDILQITLDDAKSAALSDAGVSASDVTFTKEKTDYEDGAAVHEIEFYTSSFKYEYEISAVTGEILSKETEAFSSGTDRHRNQDHPSAQISVEDAKTAALSHAGFSAADITFTKTELDMEHGQTVYEIEFYKGVTEYEYKIDAVTGSVLEYDVDHS